MQQNRLLSAVLTELNDLKAFNICTLDVHQITSITDHMIIASGTSSRHVRSMAEKLIDKMKLQTIDVLGIEADDNNEWVLVDLGSAVVHIMQQSARDFYQLEKLWSPQAEYNTASA